MAHIQQAGEEPRDEEEQRHPEDVRNKEQLAEGPARRGVHRDPEPGHHPRHEGHAGVEGNPKQQGGGPHCIKGVVTVGSSHTALLGT
jgi:hypothetical protein